jgi:hypothetical protein
MRPAIRASGAGEVRETCAIAECARLGEMPDDRTAAQARRLVSTVSCAQPAEPLHRFSVGVRRYRDYSVPALPRLEPWIDEFGCEGSAGCGREAPATNQRSAPAIPDISGGLS